MPNSLKLYIIITICTLISFALVVVGAVTLVTLNVIRARKKQEMTEARLKDLEDRISKPR